MENNVALSPKKEMKRKSREKLLKRIYYHRYMYLLFLPAIVYYIMFAYVPMYGIVLAFKNFNYRDGILFSPWVGLDNFYSIMADNQFLIALRNTLIISCGRIIFEFPVAIIIALLLNEIRHSGFKRSVQTFLTLPHFLSWVIVMGVFYNLFSDMGIVNQLFAAVGLDKLHLLTQASTFRGLLYATSDWKEAGWGAIIYMAAISGINPELYEAAIVDGASRWHMVRYVTIPAIMSVIGVMFILQLASIMSAGFDQIFNMYNAAVYDKADILDTYIYRRTFTSGLDFGSSTAIGLFKSVISFVLFFTGNHLVKKFTGKAIY